MWRHCRAEAARPADRACSPGRTPPRAPAVASSSFSASDGSIHAPFDTVPPRGHRATRAQFRSAGWYSSATSSAARSCAHTSFRVDVANRWRTTLSMVMPAHTLYPPRRLQVRRVLRLQRPTA